MSLWQTQLASHPHPLNTYHPCPEHAHSFLRRHLWLSLRLSLAAEPKHGNDPSARDLAPCEHQQCLSRNGWGNALQHPQGSPARVSPGCPQWCSAH